VPPETSRFTLFSVILETCTPRIHDGPDQNWHLAHPQVSAGVDVGRVGCPNFETSNPVRGPARGPRPMAGPEWNLPT